MSQRQVLMVFAIWMAVLPFLGFPASWEKVLACLSGLFMAFLLYRQKPEPPASSDPGASHPYAEHKSTPPAPPFVQSSAPAAEPSQPSLQ